MRRFSAFHPAALFCYFGSVLGVSMFCFNPMLIMLSFCGAVLFLLKAEKNISPAKSFAFYVIIFTAASLANPLFSHKGVTVLFFFNNNPVTLESVLYGVYTAATLITVIFWFKCFNLIFTSDKLLFLLGKISPKIALLLSSALRFVPMLKEQSGKIRQSQKAMGLFTSDSLTDKLKGNIRVYSALITWALENSVETGTSMKARGYGLKGRSHYSLFSFTFWDGVLIFAVAVSDITVISAAVTGNLDFVFYPEILSVDINAVNISAFAAFFTLCILPFIILVKEELQWKYYRSKI